MNLTAQDMRIPYGKTDAQLAAQYKALSERAFVVGLVITLSGSSFELNIDGANGLIRLSKLDDLELFIRGYELGFKTKIKTKP